MVILKVGMFNSIISYSDLPSEVKNVSLRQVLFEKKFKIISSNRLMSRSAHKNKEIVGHK